MRSIGLLIILVLTSFITRGQTISFTPELSGKFIGKWVSVYSDTSRKLGIIEAMASAAAFKPYTNEAVNLGVTDNNHWIKFNLQNSSNESPLYLNVPYPTLEYASLYIVHSNGTIDSTTIWQTTQEEQRPYNHQNYIFKLLLQPGETATGYLKVYSPLQVLVPITIQTTNSIISATNTVDILSGLYYGIMIVMLLYNLFIYFAVRDKTYLVYCHYIFWVTLTQATLQGYGQRFLWSGSEWMVNNMVNICGAMSGMTTVFFARSFLQTRRTVPKLHPFLSLIILGDIVSLLVLVFGERGISYNIINATAGLGSLFVLYVAIRVYRKGHRQAKFFLLAWTVFLASVIAYVMKDAGAIPYNSFTSFILLIGSALEAVLLSFALADNINSLKREKEQSQAEALQIARENERIIREQNVMLESKVNERTIELKASNEELNKTLIDLKEAEAHLVESEKMASLGQLTAGIAHEINNPINFVTSNVVPLKRDVEMLLDVVQTMEAVSMEEIATEDKQRKIAEYKNEIDFDYLKVEIDHLLKGIDEGASRTAEIVKGLRIFSRLDEDDLKKADLNEGIESTLIIVNNMLTNKTTVVKEYGKLPLVECYPGKLNQVFLNVLSNAVHAIDAKFGGAGGGEIKIATWCDEKNAYIKIVDNGTGMDETTKKKLFEPFFTTKEVGSGTGLGLSISWNTIRKHNGNIVVNSVKGEGSEFIFEIPIEHNINP